VRLEVEKVFCDCTDALRVDVLMKDERLLNPHHLSTWHMFLPSDAFLDQMVVAGGVHCAYY